MKRLFSAFLAGSLVISLLQVPVASAASAECPPGALFSIRTGQPCSSTTPVPTTTTTQATVNTSCVPLVLTRTLTIGSRGIDVTKLQQFLRLQGDFSYPSNTTTFGSVTAAAVRKFQARNGISAVGTVGPLTRAKIQQLGCSGTTTTTTTQPDSFARNLTIGSTGSDVKDLQIFLNKSVATRVAVIGAGSPGRETTYFGLATQAALKKYQSTNKLTVTGVFDLTTRTFINNIILTTSGNGNTTDNGNTVVVIPGNNVSSGGGSYGGGGGGGGIVTVTKIYSIIVTASDGGSVSRGGTVSSNQGSDQPFIITPNSGYEIADVKVDGVSIGKVASYTFTNVNADHTLNVVFTQQTNTQVTTHTISTTVNGQGSINPGGTISVNEGTSKTLTFTPSTGYQIQSVLVDGTSIGAANSYTFNNVRSNHTVVVNFVQIPVQPTTYTITSSAGTGGRISPSGITTVVSGDSQLYTITPNSGYQIASVMVNGSSVGSPSTYTFNNVSGNQTISATFSQIPVPTYTVTATAGVGGSISPIGTNTVNQGTAATYTIIPDSGYLVQSVVVDGVNKGAVSAYTFPNTTTGSHSISVTFVPITVTYNITASAGTGGSISPSGVVSVNQGTNKTFIITPATGYQIASVSVNGQNQGAISSYTFNNINSNQTITATFSLIPVVNYTITASAGTGGSISPSGSVSVGQGDSKTFTITPSVGYQIASVSVNGQNQGAVTTYTFNNVNSNQTITASFIPKTYTITASAGTGGSISPSGTVTINSGATQNFTVTANSGYQISQVLVDGSTQAIASTYSFTNISANHTISANFTAIPTYTVTASAGTGGTVSPATQTVLSGGNVTITITPNTGYQIASITVDGTTQTLPSGNTFTLTNVTSSKTVAVTFSQVTSTNVITSMTLVNADTGADIRNLNSTDSIDLGTLPTKNLNIRANIGSGAQSVVFGYDANANYQTQTSAPLAFAGDTDNVYNPWTPTVGNHTITATPYSGTGGTGTAGTVFTVALTVTDSTTNPPVSTEFIVGDRVQVTSTVNVRATPSTTGTINGSQSAGALGTVIGGPTASGGYTWWQINYDTGADGWSIEGNLTKYTVTPPTSDTQAPTAPTNLTATAASASIISLTWSPSTDNVGVTGYRIYRNGASTPIATVSTNAYSDTGLTAATSYSYTIAAIDAAGNVSAQSTSKSATTNTATTGGNGNTYYVATTGSDSNPGTSAAPWKTMQKALDATKAGDTVIVRAGSYAGMNTLQSKPGGGSYGGTASAPITFLADSGVTLNKLPTTGGNANLAIINLEGSNGNYIIKGFTIDGTNADTQRAGLRFVGCPNCKILNNTIHNAFIGIHGSYASNMLIEGNICYNATDQHGIYVATDFNDSTVRGNRLYNNNWDGLHMNTLNGNTVSRNIIENNVIYGNNLSGMDIEGISNNTYRNNIIYNNSKHGITIHSQDQANTPVSKNNAFINNTIYNNSYFGIQIQSADTQGEVIFNNILLTQGNTYGSLGFNGTTAGVTSDYNIVMDSFSTNLGASRQTLAQWQATGKDTHSIIGSASNLFVNPGSADFHLKSGAAAIDAGTSFLGGYSAPNVDFSGASRPQGNGYDIGAYESGNVGTPTDTQAPSVPANLSASSASLSSIALSWNASTDNTGVAGYKLYRNGSLLTTTSATSYTDTGLTTGTTYTYYVTAFDNVGNTSAQSTSVSASPAPDTQAPTVPSGVSASALSSSQVAVSWNASTDNAAVTGYKVYRNGTQVTTTSNTSYTDSGLTAATSYSYTIAAYDAAGNTSLQSSNAFATTLDSGTNPVSIVAVDSSSPARVTTTTGCDPTTGSQQATSASFTAPANALIIATVNTDGDVQYCGRNPSVTVSGGGKTWTTIATESGTNGGTGGLAGAWYTTSSGSSMTVTASVNVVGTISLKVYVVTGAGSIGATARGTSLNGNLTTTAYTSTAANSLGFAVGTDWSANAVPTSSDIADGFISAGNISGVSVYKSANTISAGTPVSFNLNSGGSSASWNWVTFEVKPATVAFSGSSIGKVAGTETTCVVLNNRLVLGSTDASTNGEVSLLQTFLKVQGDYTYPEITGYYGAATAAAVQAFQARNGLEPVGEVGALTSAKIQLLSCGN